MRYVSFPIIVADLNNLHVPFHMNSSQAHTYVFFAFYRLHRLRKFAGMIVTVTGLSVLVRSELSSPRGSIFKSENITAETDYTVYDICI